MRQQEECNHAQLHPERHTNLSVVFDRSFRLESVAISNGSLRNHVSRLFHNWWRRRRFHLKVGDRHCENMSRSQLGFDGTNTCAMLCYAMSLQHYNETLSKVDMDTAWILLPRCLLSCARFSYIVGDYFDLTSIMDLTTKLCEPGNTALRWSMPNLSVEKTHLEHRLQINVTPRFLANFQKRTREAISA